MVKRGLFARIGLACLLGALPVVFPATTPPTEAATCSPVTHGTLAQVVAEGGLIVVARVTVVGGGDTPATDHFAIQEVIRPQVPGQGLDLRAGTLIVVSNACWNAHVGDRIIAIFPYPDGMVAEKSVAWRIGSDGLVEQISSQDVTDVPPSANALIAALERLAGSIPDTATAPSRSDPADGPVSPGDLLGLIFLASLGSACILSRRKHGAA
jgi:hypothetical protein